jgi:hypothetical protein
MLRLDKNTRILLHDFAGFGDLWVMQWAEGSNREFKTESPRLNVKLIAVDIKAPTLVLKFDSGF